MAAFKGFGMQQNKTSFFIIVGLAVLIVAGMIGASFFLTGSLGNASPLQKKVEIQVVAAPAIKPWLETAAQDFNQANPTTQVKVIAAEALIPVSQLRAGSSQTSPPAAWLAEASFVVDMARNEGLQFQDSQSVASTGLAWGGYKNKLDQFTQSYGDVTWQNLHAKAISPEGLKLVIASPQNSAEGIAALLSAAAAHLNAQSLSQAEATTALPWLTETLGDRNAHTQSRPAETFATAQGPTLGDLGLLSMASWRAVKNPPVDFSLLPAGPEVILDYPYTILAGGQSTPDTQAAAAAFRNFLLETTQQDRLANSFFDPALTTQSGVQADGEAAEQLRSWAERIIK